MDFNFAFSTLSLVVALVALIWVLVTRDAVWLSESRSYTTHLVVQALESRIDSLEHQLTQRENL